MKTIKQFEEWVSEPKTFFCDFCRISKNISEERKYPTFPFGRDKGCCIECYRDIKIEEVLHTDGI